MSCRVHRRRELVSFVGGFLVVATLVFSGCGDSPSASRSDSDTSDEPGITTVDSLTTVRFTDPTQSVGVALGRKFELVLPANPTRGWRWVLEPIDTAVVVALSSTFVDNAELLASTSTTTTVPETSGSTVKTEPAATWIPTTTTTIDPDSPEAAPLVQIITFAGRSLATTSIKLRYEPIVGSASTPRKVTFDVVVYAEQS